MATKRLSRTIIEGGRSGYNKHARRHSYAEERARARDELRKVLVDADLADEWGIEKRQKVFKDFADKLGPPRRWLKKQAGRPWDEVYSDLKRCFDPRTTSGRHIVYDHMLGWVHRGGEHPRWRHECTVDNDGILRESPRTPRQHWSWWRDESEKRRALSWMAGRKVIDYGTALFWAVPVERVTRPLSPDRTKVDRTVVHYRQDLCLTKEEARFWQGLRLEIRKELGVDGGVSSSSASRTMAVQPADYRQIGVRFPGGGLISITSFWIFEYGVRGVAEARLIVDQVVEGSTPPDRPIPWDVMRLVSLSDCRSDSDGFDPHTSRLWIGSFFGEAPG
jgi:hypothetical protein